MAPVQPNASVASTGKGIRTIGNHIYGYSGNISVSGSSAPDTIMLSFITGTEYIAGRVSWGQDHSGAENQWIGIKLNGELILDMNFDNTAPNRESYRKIVIPPRTEVEILYGSGAGSDHDANVMLTGRVYGAE